jgi:hypothetical protein
MKINSKEIPLDLLRNKLFLGKNETRRDYILGFNYFIQGFFNAAELFDILDQGEISFSDCAEHAMSNVQRRRGVKVVLDEKKYFQGSMDACQKTFQMLELAYSSIHAA